MPFFNILRDCYELNKGKVKRNYIDLSREFLNCNDREINSGAYLRRPQNIYVKSLKCT